MPQPRRAVRVAREIVLWLMSLQLVLVFLRAGFDKMHSNGGWARAFAHWGYPPWFRLAIGGLEIAAALLLLTPRTTRYGAVIIAIVMLGGMYTHVSHHEARHVLSEVLPLLFSTILFLGRRKDARVLPFRRQGRS
jgi:putative oxidoreductase